MRKPRLLAILVPLVALALPAAAQLEKYKDWDKSPEFTYYATDDERKAWKDVKSDAEAEKLYNLFWGKRHPDYQKTPQNAFKLRFDALVAKADEQFALGKPGERRAKRGALTERGKVLILLGPPTAITSQRVATGPGSTSGTQDEASRLLTAAGEGMALETRFRYEQTQLPAWTDLKALVLTFTTDQSNFSESVDKSADVKRLQKKAAAAALVNPSMTEPPVYKTREQFEAEQKAAADAAAEAARGPALSAPVREALEALLAKEPQGAMGAFSLAFGDKATRLMVQLPIPGSAVPAPAPAAQAATAAPAPAEPPTMKLAVLVKSKDGKDAARREESVVLQKAKGGYFADLSLPVDAGEYDVAALLLDADGGVKLSARRSATVQALPAELGLSQLLVAYNDLPADGAKPDEPFVFSSRKFVLRGDSKHEKTDGLAYMVRLYNPSVDPATRKLNLKRSISIKPKNGSTIDVPQSPDEPMAVPEGQGVATALVIDLAGSIVDTNLGDYFRPGDYTLLVKVTDVVAGKTVEVRAPFTLVAPPAAAASSKAPAAKGAPKK